MSMPKRREEPDTVQFTITLNRLDADLLESLIGKPGRKSSRAAIAADMICKELQRLHEIGEFKGQI
jgi:hypothetical protein